MKNVVLVFVFCLALGLPLMAPEIARGHLWAISGLGREGDLENQIEQQLESEIEDELEDEIEDELEDEIEDELEDEIEDELEDEIEDELEDEIEDELEDEIEDELEDEIEDELEDEIEDELEDEIEDELEDEVEDELEDEVEDELEDEVEDELDDDEIEDELDDLEDENEDGRDEKDEDDFDDEHEQTGEIANQASEDSGTSSNTRGGPADAEQILDRDDFDHEFAGDDWLILASVDEIRELEERGLAPREVEVLNGLDLVLAKVALPDRAHREQRKTDFREVVDAVDFNHTYRRLGDSPRPNTYRLETRATREQFPGAMPTELYDLSSESEGEGLAIGIIDTQINTQHAALKQANVRAQSFVRDTLLQPSDHGTSVASIIVGQSANYHGLLPQAEIYSASVFSQVSDNETTATTTNLVRALDWMTANSVPVVNMSLTGPPNAVLEQAIDRAYTQGTVVVAAVGNAGPNAEPLYPAAYRNVVAVTAIGRQRRVYRLANRGDHLDFAAPGIDVQHALYTEEFASSSGTSMAAPFVAAILAVYSDPDRGITPDLLERLAANAEDLGQTGFDRVYGHGLIRPLQD